MTPTNNNVAEFSYYGLSLLSFLRLSHPHKATDTSFIKARAELASEIFSDAIIDGSTHIQASELANEALYRGLHFSLHDTIVEILWNEFTDEVPTSLAAEFAIKLYPNLADVFSKYNLTDDFAGSSEYMQLYTELTGAILIWIEDNGVQ